MDEGEAASHRKRSPSLARHDCQTSVARRRRCDRAPPHSRKASSESVRQFSWQPGFSLRNKPVKKSIARRPSWNVSRPRTGSHQLASINAPPAKARGDERSLAVAPSSSQAVSLDVMDASVGPDELDAIDQHSKTSSMAGLSSSAHTRSRALSIPTQVLYDGHFDRLKPIFERCG